MSWETRTKPFTTEAKAQSWVDNPVNEAVKISIEPNQTGVLLTYKTKHDTA